MKRTATTNKTRQAIVVLGMHRSGTSALAGALGMLGMRLPDSLMPPTADNQKGYFESVKIYKIHEQLLAAAGTSWAGIERLPADWFQSAEASAFANELVAAVLEDFGDTATFVLKDPRMCRLMPLWRKVFAKLGAEARFAIPLRNPLEVARSLKKRDGLPLEHGCLLWLRHILEAERETRGARRAFVQYNDLLADPTIVAEDVASRLADETPVPNERSKQAVASLIDPDLRHHIAKTDELHSTREFYPWLSEAYGDYAALVERPNDKAVQRRLDRLRAVFEPAVASFSPLLAARDAALAEEKRRIDELNRTIAERDAALTEERRKMVATVHELSILQDKIAVQNTQLASLNKIVAERDGKIASLGQAAAARDDLVTSLTNQLQEIYGSTVWQLIAPVRWYGRLRQWTFRSAEHRGNTLEALKPDSSDQPKPDSVDQPSIPTRSASSFYRCSLVIPTKNGGELFKRAVEALRTQTCWQDVEFIVIDSGSTDETISVARAAGAVVHSIPPNEFNHGSTRDYGISLAESDHVILMVQDAIPNDSFLIERLLSAFSDEGVAGVYARQLPQPTADAITKRNLNSWLTGGTERKVKAIDDFDCYEKLPPIEKYRFCNFDNVCSAINKRVWKDEPFGHIDFGEDIDWAARVLKRKYKIVYEPGAVVIHSHDRSLIYDYKRTYICHRLLYRRFGLHLVPSLRGVLRAWLRSSVSDLLLVVRSENCIWKKLKMSLTIPLANLLSAIGQYRAVQDETRGTANHVQDV